MARSITPIRCAPRMADASAPPQDSGLEPRVARLETDVAEIKAILNRLAPRIDEMYGFVTAKLPELATKAELGEVRAKLPEIVTRAELADFRGEVKEAVAALRTETKSEIAALRTETKSEISALRLEITQRPTRRQAVFDIFAIVGLIGQVLTIASHLAQ
ncbi:MAG TPA: hypothetical protein VE687_07245 [Stellaceae bacterium]|nr:hypothetical protein [Stellaceae bacterium]